MNWLKNLLHSMLSNSGSQGRINDEDGTILSNNSFPDDRGIIGLDVNQISAPAGEHDYLKNNRISGPFLAPGQKYMANTHTQHPGKERD